MSTTRTMLDMHSDPKVAASQSRSSVKRRFSEYGRYFARKYRENSDAYNAHYGDATGYRRATVRECWPFVGDHAKRYFREAFDAEISD